MLDWAIITVGRVGHLLLDLPRYHRMVVTPLQSFADHDHSGGHTITRHIRKTMEELQQRLQAEPQRTMVSTFWSETVARLSANYVISDKLKDVLVWINLPGPNPPQRIVLRGVIPVVTSIGVGLNRSDGRFRLLRGVRVVLVRTVRNDFFILTAYPE